MRKKLEGNGMWESSRMMLPEHKDRINQENRQKVRQSRPDLTDEEQRELFGRLKASLSHTLSAKITIYGVYENREIIGTVTALDPRLHLVKLQAKDDWHLVEFVDVVGVELDVDGY